MQTFMPKVARKPASLAMEVPLLMEDLTDQFSQKNLGTKKTRETQIGELLAARKQPPRKNVDLHSATADGLFKQFFAQHDGVVVGESHIDAAPRQWMIQGMPTLRAQGVTTLYLEHVMGSMQKHVLDAYHRAPPHSPMPRELSLALRAIDRNLGGHVAVPRKRIPDGACTSRTSKRYTCGRIRERCILRRVAPRTRLFIHAAHAHDESFGAQ